MLAHILTRSVSLDGKPVAMTARRGDRSIEATLRDVGVNIGASTLYPPVDGNVIAFKTAALARRIAIDTTLLDLRDTAEASLLRDLRGLHKFRVERVKRRVSKAKSGLGPMAKPARSAAATRRPRKATHTGRTG